MAFSLFLHILTCCLSVYFCHLGVGINKKAKTDEFQWNASYIISFLLLLLFIGFRENLGRDWDTYIRLFEGSDVQDFVAGETREFGFLLLIEFCHFLGVGSQTFIFFLGLISLILFFKAFRKLYYLLPGAIFVFFVDLPYPAIINAMRQTIAIFAFLTAISYVGEKGKTPILFYLLYFCIGALFHYSIILFLPSWFLYKIRLKLYYFIPLCIGIFLFCSVFIMSIYGDIFNLIPKYEHYADAGYVVNDKSTFGMGAFLLLFVRLTPLLIYNSVYRNPKPILYYFVLYYIGLSVYYGFYQFLLISRFTHYFQFCELIVMSYFIYYSFKSRLFLLKISSFVLFALFVFNYVYTFGDFLTDHLNSRYYTLWFMQLFH